MTFGYVLPTINLYYIFKLQLLKYHSIIIYYMILYVAYTGEFDSVNIIVSNISILVSKYILLLAL